VEVRGEAQPSGAWGRRHRSRRITAITDAIALATVARVADLARIQADTAVAAQGLARLAEVTASSLDQLADLTCPEHSAHVFQPWHVTPGPAPTSRTRSPGFTRGVG
jgi:hypothetical protein